jgi:DNA ligase-1
MLAHNYDPAKDYTGWYMSEKLDGVRAWWTGEFFLSRTGRVFNAPDWFLEEMRKVAPKTELDGELFTGRGMFPFTNATVNKSAGNWQNVTFMVFDAPRTHGNFKTRYESLLKLPKSNICRQVKHEKIENMDHFQQALKQVLGQGGEGLILRDPASYYTGGRSWSMIKVKPEQRQSATVVGHVLGRGKHEGTLGSLMCQLDNGIQFKVGTGLRAQDRQVPPALGSRIQFKYQELTKNGVPRFPVFLPGK